MNRKLTNPVLSIITVSKNDRKGLEKTYSSIASQTLRAHQQIFTEWIIIDGGSKDETTKFVNSITFSGELIFQSEPDEGIFDAMNKGVRLARGRYVFFLNAGDRFRENTVLSNLLDLCEQYSNSIIAGSVQMHWGLKSIISNLSPWVCHQSVLIPKSIFNNYKFDATKRYFGDLHLWMQLDRDGLFNVNRVDLIVSDFDLGGVGNKPEHIWKRLIERNSLDCEFNRKPIRIIRLLYALLMFATWKTFGENAYYSLMWLITENVRFK